MAASRGGRSSPWATRTFAGSFILLSFPRDPFADLGRATEQLGALPLALPQEVDDIDADYGDSLQVQGGTGTADLQLERDLPEVLGLHGPDQPDGRPGTIRAALDLERHPSPPFRRTRVQRGAPEPSRYEARKKPPSAPSRSCFQVQSRPSRTSDSNLRATLSQWECLGLADRPSSNCQASAQPFPWDHGPMSLVEIGV